MSKLNVLQVLIGKIKSDYNPTKDSNELNFMDANKINLSDFGKEKSKVFKICLVENKELNYLVFIIDDKKIFLDINPEEDNINWDKILECIIENMHKEPNPYYLQEIIRSSWDSQNKYPEVIERIKDWEENVSFAITDDSFSESIPIDTTGSELEFDTLSVLQNMEKGKYADYFDPSNSYLLELGYASSVDSPSDESEKLQYDSVEKNINGFEGNKLLILVKPEKNN